MWLFLFAVRPQLFAHSTYNWALKYFAAALASLVMLAEPIVACFLLDETPTIVGTLGGLLILLGIGFGSVRTNSDDRVLSET